MVDDRVGVMEHTHCYQPKVDYLPVISPYWRLFVIVQAKNACFYGKPLELAKVQSHSSRTHVRCT